MQSSPPRHLDLGPVTIPAAGPASEPVVRVGVAVLVRRDGHLLLGRRRSASHGDGEWQLPGGHLEFMETVEACAAREAAEETGLAVQVRERGPYTADVFAADQGGHKHYLTLFVIADAPEGEPAAMEPDKCEGWAWFDWDALPEPLFLPLRTLVASGYRPPAA